MMDPLRNEYAPPNSPLLNERVDERLPIEDHAVDELLAGIPPESALPPGPNPRLNQAAQSIGAALGTTVGKMRSGLTLVQDRQREIAREVSDRVSQQAENISATVMEKTEQLGDLAEEKSAEFVDMAQRRWNEASHIARQRVIEMRRQAATLRDEHPIELILSFAGAAFVVGVALRVWRANND